MWSQPNNSLCERSPLLSCLWPFKDIDRAAFKIPEKLPDRWLSAAALRLFIRVCQHIWLRTSAHCFTTRRNTTLLLTAWPGSFHFSQGLIHVACKHINWQLIWRSCSRCACKSGVWTWQAALLYPYGLAAQVIFHLLPPPFFFLSHKQTNAPKWEPQRLVSEGVEGGGAGGLTLPVFPYTWWVCVWRRGGESARCSSVMLMSVLPHSEHDDVRVSSTAATVCLSETTLLQHQSGFLSTS